MTRRMQSLLLENLVLGKKSNQQTKTMRTKTNYKPKANDKGKENNAIFFESWPIEFSIKERGATQEGGGRHGLKK